MKYVDASIYMIAGTQIYHDELNRMLRTIGTDWQPPEDVTDAENLVQVGGKLCYKSFEPGLNANVTKVRDDPGEYIKNILKSRHGSVIAHPSVTFALLNVSRILTHEIVRHTAGTAFSQESGRFVRLDEFQMYRPDGIGEVLEELGADLVRVSGAYDDIKMMMELHETRFQKVMDSLPWEDMSFAQKKRMTSAMRRYAPAGTVNHIMVTGNHRAWRWICEARISGGAEEEIFIVQKMIAKRLYAEFPLLYQDLRIGQIETGLVDGESLFEYSKV